MNRQRILRILTEFGLCLSAAYVALLPQFYMVFNAGNRYTLLWSRAYHLAILSAIALFALVLYAAQSMLRAAGRRWGLVRWADIFCMLWMAFLCLRTITALLVQWESLPPVFSRLLWNPVAKGALYALPLPFLLRYPVSAKRVLKRWYGVLSLLLASFVATSASWTKFDHYQSAGENQPGRLDQADGRNILIFVMDEWSFDRTFSEPDWQGRFPHLAALAAEGTFFSQAYSLGVETYAAIPRLLFSNDEAFSRRPYKEVVEFNHAAVSHAGTSIFKLAPGHWLKAAIGFYLNYPVILAGHVDVALRFESEYSRRTYSGELRRLMLSQFAFLRIVGIKYDYVIDPEWFPQMEIHEHAMRFLRDNPGNLISFFHYAWPHYPYIWNRHGRKPGRIDPEAAKVDTVENYMDNLDFLDVVIGEICATLREAGKWEDSLLVITSDHTWRMDPVRTNRWEADLDWRAREDTDPWSEWRHVPLIIKWPGSQFKGRHAAEPVSLGNLWPLLDRYIQGEGLGDPAMELRMSVNPAP